MQNNNLILLVAGGIGNQLFMYATAKRLAENNGARLLLDTYSGFEGDSYKQTYQLNNFSVLAEEAPMELTFYGRWGPFQRNFFKKINRLLPYEKRWLIKEEINPDGMTFFDLRLIDLKLNHKNTYMIDCFQCEKYFLDIREELLKELVVRTPLNEKTIEISKKISSTHNSVAIHARQLRGAPNIVGASAPEGYMQKTFSYYEQAIEHMGSHLKSPHFFCFGDDPAWLHQNWNSNYPATFVSHNNGQEEAVQDFHLMSLCKHFIIGNSSFSWWPAWLSENPDKIVIAPKNEKPYLWSGNKNVIPSDWVVL